MKCWEDGKVCGGNLTFAKSLRNVKFYGEEEGCAGRSHCAGNILTTMIS